MKVNFATANGTAASPDDYTPKAGTLSFAAGVTTMAIKVAINPDTAVDGNETFKAKLSGASGASITRAIGIATFVDDDWR